MRKAKANLVTARRYARDALEMEPAASAAGPETSKRPNFTSSCKALPCEVNDFAGASDAGWEKGVCTRAR